MRAFLPVVLLVVFANGLQQAAAYADTQTSVQAKIRKAVESNDSVLLAQALPDVEKLWHEEPVAYFQSARQVVYLLAAAPKNADATRSLTTLFTNMLCKPCPVSNEQAISCFDVKRDVVLHCLNYDEVRNDKAVLMAIARFLGEVRSRVILNYSNRGTAQPGREVLRQAGVRNPNSITNSVLKQAYEQAVKKNEEDLVMNRLQLALFRANQTVTFHLLRASVRLAQKDPQDKEFIEGIISSANMTEDERQKRNSLADSGARQGHEESR